VTSQQLIDGFKAVYGSEKPAAAEVARVLKGLKIDKNQKFDYLQLLNEAIHNLEY
jgi:hypothetical protein